MVVVVSMLVVQIELDRSFIVRNRRKRRVMKCERLYAKTKVEQSFKNKAIEHRQETAVVVIIGKRIERRGKRAHGANPRLSIKHIIFKNAVNKIPNVSIVHNTLGSIIFAICRPQT